MGDDWRSLEDRVLVRLAKSWEVMSWSRSREGETASGEAMWLGILILVLISHKGLGLSEM